MSTLNWVALEAVQDWFRKVAFDIVADGEEVHPMLFAVHASDDGQVLKYGIAPGFEPELFSSEHGKNVFAQMLPHLVNDTPIRRLFSGVLGFTPNVFVQINEVWTALGVDPDKRLPSERDDRREGVLIALHLADLTIPTMHMIEDKPTRHAVKAPFPKPEDMPNYTGRMVLQGDRGAAH